jgi:hypothetical protein
MHAMFSKCPNFSTALSISAQHLCSLVPFKELVSHMLQEHLKSWVSMSMHEYEFRKLSESDRLQNEV